MAPYTIVSAPTLEKGPVYRFTEKAPYHIPVRRTDVRNGYGYCLAELLDAPLESDLLEGIVDELNAKGIEFRITYDADREWLRTCTESVTDDGVPVYRYPESSFNPYYYRFTERKTGKHIAVFINAPSWCIPMYKLFRDLDRSAFRNGQDRDINIVFLDKMFEFFHGLNIHIADLFTV